MYTFFYVCMLLAVADYIPRTCSVPRSSFVSFLVQAKELHQKEFQPCYQGPSSHIHSLFEHLPFLFSFFFLSGCISFYYVPSSFAELLCCPRCWSVQHSLVGGGGGLTATLGTVLLVAVALWPDMLSTWLFARSHYSHGLIRLGSFASGTKSCALVPTV
jgi:hypothetical protein